MSTRTLWFLLAASVAVNVFFLGGLYSPQLIDRAGRPAGPDPIAKVAEELQLDEAQSADLAALRQRVAERRLAAGGEAGSFRALLITELAKPDFDRAGLEERMQDRRAVMGIVVLDVAEDLHGYLATLSPEQKTAFLERAGDRGFLRRLLWAPRRDRGQ